MTDTPRTLAETIVHDAEIIGDPAKLTPQYRLARDLLAAQAKIAELEQHLVTLVVTMADIMQQRDAMRKLIPLVQEIMAEHRDQKSSSYNECDKPEEECMWCGIAKVAIEEAGEAK